MQPLVVKPREVKLSTRTEISVRRLLPHAALRRIGAWVFLDHFGPTEQQEGMRVQRHPHTGLQTVTWLFDGLVEHRDSVGSIQEIRPGQLNLMTAGRGVAHSEVSLSGSGSYLHAVQLWLALPEAVRGIAPSFQHVETASRFKIDSAEIAVFIGAYAGIAAQARVYSPLVGAQVELSGKTWLPLRPDWEHGFLVADGQVSIGDSVELQTNELGYIALGERGVWLDVPAGRTATLVLLGGEPFDEELIMWWNFIARTPEELRAMREEWNAQAAPESDLGRDALAVYPEFADALGGWIPAPDLPNVTLRPRGA